MKQLLKKIFSSPKIIIGITIVIALGIGVASTIIHNATQAEMFANVTQTVTSTNVTNGSAQDLTLAFPIGGRIKSVSVKIGDKVVAGQVLASLDADNALGAISQAKAAYTVAQTAYDKLVNGASTPDREVSQAAVASATIALNNANQNLIRDLSSAYNNVNSTLLSNTNNLFTNPQSSAPQFYMAGTIQSNQQLVTQINNERLQVNSDMVAWGDEVAALDQSTVSKTMADSKSYMTATKGYLTDMLNVATSYSQPSSGGTQATLAGYQNSIMSAKTVVDSAYTTITNDAQAVKSAQAALDQANASLALKQAPARSEDLAIARAQVESTQGALQIAQGAYNNTIITAPISGTIINVSITAGQIATPNIAAIEMSNNLHL